MPNISSHPVQKASVGHKLLHFHVQLEV
uniref:Uncharacterized protein n=1 Tax=Arundo donax TaxID=35708 RepID=A0A0A9HQK1_ARUDO